MHETEVSILKKATPEELNEENIGKTVFMARCLAIDKLLIETEIDFEILAKSRRF